MLCGFVAAALVACWVFLSFSFISHHFEPGMKRDAQERFEALDKRVSCSLDVARLLTLGENIKSLQRDTEALDKRISDLSDSGRIMKRDALERFEALDKRVSDRPDAARLLTLESEYKSLKGDTVALDRRISDLSDIGKSIGVPVGISEELPLVDACRQNLNDFTTIKVMQEAGWGTSGLGDWIVGGRFTGWKSGQKVGSMKLRFNVSGRMMLRFSNPFPEVDPQNVVTVNLNEQMVAIAERMQHAEACFIFQKGDVLTLAERYAQIEIWRLKVSCFPEKGRVNCGVGRAVQVRPLQCNATGGQAGVIQKIINMNEALVDVGAPTARHTAHEDLYVQPDNGEVFPTLSSIESAYGLPPVLRCDSFVASQQQRIGMLSVATWSFRHSYEPQIETMRCYARRQGYAFFLIDDSDFPACDRISSWDGFFFQKHCLVAEFLRRQRPGYVAVVLDTDVVAGVLGRGLDEWLSEDYDLQFYSRMGNEIAAGNYIARNTPWTLEFLMGWAQYYWHQPKGFSSADNGAIHVHILESLGVPGHDDCRKAYQNLVSLVPGGSEYFHFVNCFREKLQAVHGGTRASSYLVHSTNRNGSIALFPEKSNWVVDVHHAHYSESQGPVFLHGVKKRSDSGTTARTEPTALNAVKHFYEDPYQCKIRSIPKHYRLDNGR